MKQIKLLIVCLLGVVALTGCSVIQEGEELSTETQSVGQTEEQVEISPESDNPGTGLTDPQIRLSFEGGEAIMRLNDSAAAQSFVSQLPMTQTFEDFNSIEKICRLSEEIPTEGAEMGIDPSVADVTLYAPWNTLVFYYEDYGYNDDLIPMGHVESGMELLAAMGDEFEVTMELVDEDDLNAEDTSAETTEITMTAGDTVISTIIDDSETTQEFLSTLPRTIEMNRYDDREYYGRIEAISENGESITDFEDGDVTYYPAGPSFAVFFDGAERSSQSGLIRIGKITSDLAVFETLGESIEVTIDVVKE